MKKYVMSRMSILGASLILAVLVGVPALAVGTHAHANAETGMSAPGVTNDNRSLNSGSHSDMKLTNAKLKSCQKHEKAITNTLSRLSDRGQKQVVLFGTIASRVETFYTDKGKTLASYDALVADVNAKAAAAQTALSGINAAGSGFSCDGSNPSGFMSTFKDNLKLEISALKDYRTSVRNLIVGVKSVQGTTSSTDNKAAGGNQ